MHEDEDLYTSCLERAYILLEGKYPVPFKNPKLLAEHLMRLEKEKHNGRN